MAEVKRFDEVPFSKDATVVASLTWDLEADPSVDMDIQAVIVDKNGRITDAAYYNCVKACRGAVVHSGDQHGEAGGKGRERLTFALQNVPEDKHMIMFLICCFKGSAAAYDMPGVETGQLSKVKGAKVEISQEGPEKSQVCDLSFNDVTGRGRVLGTFLRTSDGSGWTLSSTEIALPDARHFMDALPAIRQCIAQRMPEAVKPDRAEFFDMCKRAVAPLGVNPGTVTLRLSWGGTPRCDLDLAAVLFSTGGDHLESVFPVGKAGRLKSEGTHSRAGAVEHSGDVQLGGDKDADERITVSLDELGETVGEVHFCIYIPFDLKNKHLTFQDVSDPLCRVLKGGPNSEEVICQFAMIDAGSRQGVIIGSLFRSHKFGGWSFQALGTSSKSNFHADFVSEMKPLLQKEYPKVEALKLEAAQAALKLKPVPEVPVTPAVTDPTPVPKGYPPVTGPVDAGYGIVTTPPEA